METKEREVKVAIREMHSGEAPETYICAARFEEFSCINGTGFLDDQMTLVAEMVKHICEDGMKTNSEYMPVVVAGILSTIESAVGEEVMTKGVKLLEKATKPKASIEELLEHTEKLLEELGLLK